MYSSMQAVAVINWAAEVCLYEEFLLKNEELELNGKAAEQQRAQCLKLLKNVQIKHYTK